MPPSTSVFVSFSNPMLPEQNTIPFALMAWEKTGSGAGALRVLISVMPLMFVGWGVLYCIWEEVCFCMCVEEDGFSHCIVI